MNNCTQDRVYKYLGGISDKNLKFYDDFKFEIPAPDSQKTHDHAPIIRVGCREIKNSIYARWEGRISRALLDSTYENYILQAQSFFSHIGSNFGFDIAIGDNAREFNKPAICKSRPVSQRMNSSVLLPLNLYRHWGDLRCLADMDIPFEDKDDSLVWRGATTGCFKKNNQSKIYSARYFVAGLEDLPDDIDIGYSSIVQIDQSTSDRPMDQIMKMLKPGLSIKDQLRSKYILSLEGNDVATGLKWIMASNSVPIMPRPTVETWFLEGDLVAWEHYVPVNGDLSNLVEVYDWCRSNERICQEIVKNSQDYVSKFLKSGCEFNLAKHVASEYANHTRIAAPASSTYEKALSIKLYFKLISIKNKQSRFWKCCRYGSGYF